MKYMNNKWRLFISCTLVMIMSSLFYFTNGSSGPSIYGKMFTLADCFVWGLKPNFYGITVIPMLLLIVNQTVKRDFRIMYVIRCQSKARLYAKALLENELICIVMAFITTISIGFSGALVVKDALNWKFTYSLYYIITKETNSKVTIFYLIIMFFLESLLRNTIVAFLYQIILWKFEREVISFLLVVSITGIEICTKRVQLFYHVLSLDYERISQGTIVMTLAIYAGIFLLTFFYLSNRVVKQKEFF